MSRAALTSTRCTCPPHSCLPASQAQRDGTWAIKSQAYGWYVRGVVGKQPATLSAFDKELSPDALWKVHLAMHPQITLKNIKRRRFVSESGNDTLTTRADNPFGQWTER